MADSGIYEIVNLVNGKRYVGSAVSFKRRWTYHRRDLRSERHHSKYLQNSWRKYGEDSFAFLVIENVTDVTKLIEREQFYIDTLWPEYNVSPTAGSCLGVRWSDEQRAARSQLNKKLWADPAFSGRMKAAMRAGITPEVRAQQSLRMSEDNPFLGKRHSKETRQALSAGKHKEWSDPQYRDKHLKETLERLQSPQAIEKRSAKMRGRKLTDEHRAKVGEASKAAWQDETYREKRAASLTAALAHPDCRAKKSAATKLLWESEVHRSRISKMRSGLGNPAAISREYAICDDAGSVFRGIPMKLRALTGISPAGMSQLINGNQSSAKGWKLLHE